MQNLNFRRHLRKKKFSIVLSRIKRRILSRVWLVRSLIIITAVLLSVALLVSLGNLIGKTKTGLYLKLASDFIFTPSDKIKQSGGRTNILLLGKGGAGHDAPDLTDTIIFVSVPSGGGDIVMLSLPRDIWLADIRAKLNSAYYWGNQKQPPVEKDSLRIGGGGLILAKALVEEIVGQPIHYALVIDFSGFEKLIDALGGIEVNVQNSFVDEKYPVAGKENDNCSGDTEFKCRYETIHFSTGFQHMDGATALKFVRSRNAQGDEGTDFARAKRQQLVLEALKQRFLDRQIILSPKKLSEIKNILLDNTETDLNQETIAVLAHFMFVSRNKIKTDAISDNLLENPPKSPKYDNLYVLIPKDESSQINSGQDWSKIKEWVKEILK